MSSVPVQSGKAQRFRCGRPPGPIVVKRVGLPRQVGIGADAHLAWSALVEAFGPSVWLAARTAGASPQQAAETCQLVWLRLEMLSRCSGLPSDLPAWLAEQVADTTRAAAMGSA